MGAGSRGQGERGFSVLSLINQKCNLDASKLSAWTNDPVEQQKLINAIKAGALFINSLVKSDPRLPFGGINSSGYGRELGVEEIREFVNQKTVWVE